MIDLGLRRHRSRDRARAPLSCWVGRVEALEARVALTNGLVGVPAEFIAPPVHDFLVTSVPEDPANTGIVGSTAVTAVGKVWNPAGGAISSFHTLLEIDALEGGTIIGSVTWNVAAGPGTITGPSYFGQDPTAANQGLFSLPFTLKSSSTTPQNVTFQIQALGQQKTVVLQSNTTQPLTGTFVVNPAAVGPTVSSISSVSSPRLIPVPSIDVTFSKAINPATFTTAALTLTKAGSPVSLGSDVTFTTTDNTTFTVGGLSSYTTDFASYVFTVDATKVKDPSGTAGSGAKSTSFVVVSPTAPPTIQNISPVASPRTDPVQMITVTFSKPIDPTTFTTADVVLTRDGTKVELGNDVSFVTTDDMTFSIQGLAIYTTAPADYSFLVNATGVKDTFGNSGLGTASIEFLVQAPVVDTGPRVIALKRYGIHGQPVELVLTFDRPLTAASASDPSNYAVYGPGRDGVLGTLDDLRQPIATGYYNSANKTVTIVMSKPLYLSRHYLLVALGTGSNPITDTNGVKLDGQSNGQPGYDFSTIFGREVLKGINFTTSAGQKNAQKAARFLHYQVG